jgi:hypothetical protein
VEGLRRDDTPLKGINQGAIAGLTKPEVSLKIVIGRNRSERTEGHRAPSRPLIQIDGARVKHLESSG